MQGCRGACTISAGGVTDGPSANAAKFYKAEMRVNDYVNVTHIYASC
jgi:hypothetical protein